MNVPYCILRAGSCFASICSAMGWLKLNSDFQFVVNPKAEGKAQIIEAVIQPSGTSSVRIGQAGIRKEYGRR
jgi:hypothetical protein